MCVCISLSLPLQLCYLYDCLRDLRELIQAVIRTGESQTRKTSLQAGRLGLELMLHS